MKSPTFIETYENVFPEGFCEFLIENFEKEKQDGRTYNRQQTEDISRTMKEDDAISITGYSNLPKFDERYPSDVIWDSLQRCFLHYSDKYASLKDGPVRGVNIKLQRVPEGGGYHVWHAEQAGHTLDQATRCLVFMVYLNDLLPEQCGDTEFLYQQVKISPKQNTGVLWPAAFTHPHRGNPVYEGGVKYIITGWYHCHVE